MTSRFVLAAAGLLFLLAIWIVLPPFTRLLLNLTVAIPELSAWVLTLGILTAIAALADLRALQPPAGPGRHQAARVALALSLATAALAIAPLERAHAAIARLDAAMREGFGDDVLRDRQAAAGPAMRRQPIVVPDLFLGIDPAPERVTRGIEFAAPEGVALHLDVHAPPFPGPYPVIVQVYGGAWQRGTPGDDAGFAGYFAARGYVVFAIDYRHAPRWRWPAQTDDVRTALAWIRTHAAEYSADVNRIAIVGRSSGAHLALLAAYRPGGPPVGAVVSYYGPTDLAAGYRDPPRPDPLHIPAVLEALLGGAPDSLPDVYRDVSPITYATTRQPPTLLIYGGRDHVVSPRFGASLHQRLRAAGTRSVLLELPWADHAFDAVTFGPGAQLALYHTERFLAWALSDRPGRRVP